jgi:hypothetical protein
MNVHYKTGHEGPEGKQRYSSTLSLTSALDVGGWLTSRSGHFTTRKKNPVPIVQEAGWAAWPIRTGAENLAHTGIRSTKSQACGQSLQRPRYPGPQC